MWTTAEEPAACVGQLKHRETKNNLGIMSGHYRLVGDTVRTSLILVEIFTFAHLWEILLNRNFAFFPGCDCDKKGQK